MRRRCWWLPALASLATTACGDDDPRPAPPISYGAMGPLVGDAGKGGWRFGAASAATQIEDQNPNTDWYVWSRRTADGLRTDA